MADTDLSQGISRASRSRSRSRSDDQTVVAAEVVAAEKLGPSQMEAEAVAPALEASEPGPAAVEGSDTVMPAVPSIPVPSGTKVVVTVPVTMRISAEAQISSLRQMLTTAGVPVEDGAFHCRGEPQAVAEESLVGELKDVRLSWFPEPDLEPWQLCAAHRACERLVQQRLGQAAASRHPFYKTRFCNNWASQGHCVHGLRCIYAHGPHELRRSMMPFMPPLAKAPAKAAPKVPEVVFTVDKEEERRRAERAKRFAPRAASFEASTTGTTEIGGATETNAAEADDKDAEHTVGEGDVDDALNEAGLLNEEQIADYLLEMQQQFMTSDSIDGGFDLRNSMEEPSAETMP